MRSPRPLLLVCSVLGLLAAGCGGGPRAAVMRAVEARDLDRSLAEYERFRHDEGGGDVGLLAHVAGLVLEDAATGDDPARRRAALAQLSMAGTAATGVLERLADGAAEQAVRARALGTLARRGDSSARRELRALLGSDDPEVLAQAVPTLDPDEEREQLVALLMHTSGEVREAVAKVLEAAAPDPGVRSALAEAARVDPLPAVRAAAVRSLGGYGPGAYEPLRERLSDPSQQVRMAAVGALVRADPARAPADVAALLEMAPSQAGVEAARVLSGAGGEGAPTARAFLLRALESGEASVRSQAAVALSSLPVTDDIAQALVRRMREDPEASVKISLASLLIERPEHGAAAREVLSSLLEGEGMSAVQAASTLARHGEDGAALAALDGALASDRPDLRRAAARGMARDAMQPDRARGALRDEDPLVRIHAAGAILSAASAAS